MVTYEVIIDNAKMQVHCHDEAPPPSPITDWHTVELDTVQFFPDGTSINGYAGPTGSYSGGNIIGGGDSGGNSFFYFSGLETQFDFSGAYNFEFEFTFGFNSSDGWNWANVARISDDTTAEYVAGHSNVIWDMNDGSDGSPAPAVRTTSSDVTANSWETADALSWNKLLFIGRRNCGISQIRWRGVPV